MKGHATFVFVVVRLFVVVVVVDLAFSSESSVKSKHLKCSKNAIY